MCIRDSAFGMLKKRFRILHDEIRVPTQKAPKLILAAIILHNIAVDMQMLPFSENEEEENDDEISDEALTTQNGRAMRELVINTFFQVTPHFM